MKMKGLPLRVVPSFINLDGECNAKEVLLYMSYSWW